MQLLFKLDYMWLPGFTWDGMIHKISSKQWDAMLAVHCTAPFRLIQASRVDSDILLSIGAVRAPTPLISFNNLIWASFSRILLSQKGIGVSEICAFATRRLEVSGLQSPNFREGV